MKIWLIGEAADHEGDLRPHLRAPCGIAGLPWEAATTNAYDDLIGDADVVVSLRFSRPAGSAPPFALLHVPGAGLDQVDVSVLHPKTLVTNVFEHETPIAEFVMARLLEWEIRASALQYLFTPQTWARQYRNRLPHGEMAGKTMGLVGYGRIGRAIAARADAFGVNVIAVDDHATADAAANVLPGGALPEVLGRADYLVLACPLTSDTTGLIDAAALARMPSHSVLVNVSRAPIVDPSALFEALQDNRIGGAILDVWYEYPGPGDTNPAPADVPLWELPNAWCTPHSSAWTTALSRRRYAVIADNVNRLAAGEPLRNVVHAAADSTRRSAS